MEPYTALLQWAFEAAMASILIAQDGNELFEENARPGCKIAMIRAGESVNATRSRAAYQQCIEELNPDAEAVFDYTGSYTDSALNQQIVENMIKTRALRLWPCVGTGALAAFTTAKLNHAYALGCDSNQDAVEPGTIPTSVLHNTTYMVINTIEEWMNGTLKGTNEYYWGLASGVVGLTDFATIAGVEGVNLTTSSGSSPRSTSGTKRLSTATSSSMTRSRTTTWNTMSGRNCIRYQLHRVGQGWPSGVIRLSVSVCKHDITATRVKQVAAAYL